MIIKSTKAIPTCFFVNTGNDDIKAFFLAAKLASLSCALYHLEILLSNNIPTAATIKNIAAPLCPKGMRINALIRGAKACPEFPPT